MTKKPQRCPCGLCSEVAAFATQPTGRMTVGLAEHIGIDFKGAHLVGGEFAGLAAIHAELADEALGHDGADGA